jgi:hypothetical protein
MHVRVLRKTRENLIPIQNWAHTKLENRTHAKWGGDGSVHETNHVHRRRFTSRISRTLSFLERISGKKVLAAHPSSFKKDGSFDRSVTQNLLDARRLLCHKIPSTLFHTIS